MLYQAGGHFFPAGPKFGNSQFLYDARFSGSSRHVAMSHVFVSYSRKDSEPVDHIVARLEGENFKVWIDREEIKGGELWRKAIVEAVDNAYAFVLMVSPHSVASDNVRKEVDLAEGAGKALIPVLLASVEPPAELRYQLAGIQWIEYYGDPDAKFNELVKVLRAYEQKFGGKPPPTTRQVEFVFHELDLSKLSPEELEELKEKVLAAIANSTNTPRTDLNVVRMKPGSVHVFVDMPANAAYEIKTAALNNDPRLINIGIDALRLDGDRNFVELKPTSKMPPKSGKRGGPCGWLGGLILTVVLLMSIAAVATALTPSRNFISSFFNTSTFTATNTYTATPSNTPTATNTLTPTPTPTWTFTSTSTPTPTPTPSLTPSPTVTPSMTPTLIPNPTAAFFPPVTSSDSFHGGGDACGTPTDETIRVIVADADQVAAVQIYYRLQNQKTGETTQWGSMSMVYHQGTFLGSWVATITPNDIPGNRGLGDYWFQFYFLATDKTGAQTQSQLYRGLVTYQECGWIT
jgi:hypothetical protein